MVKTIFRSPVVQLTLGWLIWAYLALVNRTARWTVEGEDILREYWENDQGAVLAAWHSRIPVMPVVPLHLARKWKKPVTPAAMLISMSRDGQFVAHTAQMLQLNPIRGSAANKKKDKDKGGLEALREANRKLKAGGLVCITPDGPRGPREHAGLGVIRIAQRAEAPILIWGVSVAPAKRLNTWDRLIMPRLFGRGAVVVEGPMRVPRDGDAEVLRAELETRLRAATERADKLAGLPFMPRPENAADNFENAPSASDAVK